jgi:predicted PurR-regulated permease PerM
MVLLCIGIALLVPMLLREAGQLTDVLPQWLDSAQTTLSESAQKFGIDVPSSGGEFVESFQGQAGQIFKAGAGVMAGVLAGGAAIFSFISFVFLMPIVAFYMMLDWPRLVAKIDALLPRDKAPTVRTVMNDTDRTLAGFIRGQLTVCLLLGLFYGIGLTLIGLKFGFVIGMAAGVLSIMPYVGSAFGLIMSVAVAWFTTHDLVMVGAAVIVFGIGQFIEGNFLTPKLVGENIGLHPLWVIFALMAGGALLGFTGLLIAVPVAAVIGVMVRFALSQYKKSTYYVG